VRHTLKSVAGWWRSRNLLVTPREVAVRVGRSSGCRDCRSGGSAVRGRRDLDSVRCAQYLSNVNIAAILVDLRVVFVQDSGVDARVGRDNVTIVVLLDYISGRAVLTLPSKAVILANDKVVARFVDDSDVDDSKLVRGNTVGCRNTVTDIASLSGVSASAGVCRNKLCHQGQG